MPRKKQHLLFFGAAALLAVGVVISCTSQTKAKEKPHFVYKGDRGPNGAVVVIDGKGFDREALMGSNRGEYAEAFERVYDLDVSNTGRLLLDVEYGEKAKKENMDVDSYVETKVLGSDIKISDSEYNAFVKERGIPKEQLTNQPQLKERIIAFMKANKKHEMRQTLIVSTSKKHNVEVYYPKPNVRVAVEIGQAPTTGNKGAKVTLVEFSDFQCPYCKNGAEAVQKLKKMYGSKLNVVFKNYPLPMHQQARPAAEAAMCVNEQGSDKFWKYHDLLFKNQTKLDAENLKALAKEAGANIEKFSKCVSDKKYVQFIEDDMKYGSSLSISSTPTFFINGKLIQGALPIEKFKEIIDDELGG